MIIRLLFFIFLIKSLGVYSQISWVQDGFVNCNSFVKNEGQIKDFKGEQVLFHTETRGNKYYFVKDGFYVIYEIPLKEQITNPRNGNLNEVDEEGENSSKTSHIKYRFIKSKLNAKIGGKDEKPFFYFFGNNTKKSISTIRAQGYERLIYENVFPKIDIVFEFSNDGGIKYSYLLDKGSLVEDIGIELIGANVSLLSKCDLRIENSDFTIHDKLGLIFTARDRSIIEGEYILNKNSFNLRLPLKKSPEKLIIDPLIISNLDSSQHRIYDVDFDSEGNIYAMIEKEFFVTKLYKMNQFGEILWIYQPSFDIGYYGDFAIDRSTNQIYLVEGFNPSGAQIEKINKNGTLMAHFGGDPFFAEMWRIAFSSCSNQAVIAGGGTSSPTYQTCYLDTGLVDMTMVQYVETTNCCHDVNMIALDEFGSCYQVTNRSSVGDGLFSNHLVKLPLPDLLPIDYNVPTGYGFIEATTNFFYGGNQIIEENENGYNGIATINNKVYTTNGYVLKTWDGSNGNLLSSLQIDTCCSTVDSLKILWGGIAVDQCENLFVGRQNQILYFDSTMNLINTFNLPDTITDIVIDNNGDLIVCGYSFVAKIRPDYDTECHYKFIEIDATIIEPQCDQKGSAKLTITGGTPPYDIEWNTNPPTSGTQISDLNPGVYVVTVNDSKCKGFKQIDSVVINGFIGISEIFLNAIPTNVFTPNGDDSNPYFFPFQNFQEILEFIEFEEYEFEILNRWGNVLFSTNDQFIGWNGENKSGQGAKEGVYFWKLKVKTPCELKTTIFEGFLHLIR
jgi:gliding motility-associated-like protein